MSEFKTLDIWPLNFRDNDCLRSPIFGDLFFADPNNDIKQHASIVAMYKSDWQRIERLLATLPKTADGAYVAECIDFYCPTCNAKMLRYGSEVMICE